MEYLYFLLEDSDGNPPPPTYPRLFADALGLEGFPILADPPKAIAAATALDPKKVPGKCVLSPEMVIIGCYAGADDTPGYDLIRADAEQR